MSPPVYLTITPSSSSRRYRRQCPSLWDRLLQRKHRGCSLFRFLVGILAGLARGSGSRLRGRGLEHLPAGSGLIHEGDEPFQLGDNSGDVGTLPCVAVRVQLAHPGLEIFVFQIVPLESRLQTHMHLVRRVKDLASTCRGCLLAATLCGRSVTTSFGDSIELPIYAFQVL